MPRPKYWSFNPCLLPDFPGSGFQYGFVPLNVSTRLNPRVLPLMEYRSNALSISRQHNATSR